MLLEVLFCWWVYYKTMNDYKFVEPKTQASNRTIYIDADTIKELQEWKAVQAKVLPNCGFVLSYNNRIKCGCKLK